MAARLQPGHQDSVRRKIQASQLVNRLQDHAMGRIEMTKTQIMAAKILLDKAVSNAPTINQHSGLEGGPIETQVTVVERVIIRPGDINPDGASA